MPAEALVVVAEGFTAKILGQGNHRADHDEVRRKIVERANEDIDAVATLQKNVATARDGNAAALLGDLYFSQREWAIAAKAYATAFEKGGLRREMENRMHYGVARLRSDANEGTTVDIWSSLDASTQWVAKAWALQKNRP